MKRITSSLELLTVPATVCLLVALAAFGWLLPWLFGAQWRICFFGACVVPSLAGIWTHRRWLEQHLEWAFLALVLPIGVAMCAFMPTIVSVSWDGYVHYKAAHTLVYGSAPITLADDINYDQDGIYRVGLVPWGTTDDDWSTNWRLILSEPGLDFANFVFDSGAETTLEKSGSGLTFSATTLGRLPNAAGLALGRLVGATYRVELFLGRLTNLLFYAAIMWLAIRSLHSGKEILLVIALSPILLFEACNYSYDPYCIGLLSLAAARIARELQEPNTPITLGGALFILIPFVLGLLTKAALVGAGLVLLAMPRSKFRTRAAHRVWIAACIVLAAFVVATFALPFLTSDGSGYVDTRGGQDTINPAAQLAYVIEHPIRFLITLGGMWLWLLAPWRIFSELMANFLYLPVSPLWPLVSAAEFILLIWVTLAGRTTRDNGWPTRTLRLTGIGGLVFAYSTMALSTYLTYTNYQSDQILGMQIRYLLTFITLFCLVLLNFGTKTRVWVTRRIYTSILKCFGTLRMPTHNAQGKNQVIDLAKPDQLLACVLIPAEAVTLWLALLLGFVIWF